MAFGRGSRDLPTAADRPAPIISVVTAGELRSLAFQFNWQAAKVDQMEFYLGYLKRVSIDDAEILQAYAVIDAHCQRIGQPLGKNDAWIAATASMMGPSAHHG